MSRGKKALLAFGAIVIASGVALVFFFGPKNVAEVTETLTEGPERQLDELTPIRGGERMIFVCLDGVGAGVLDELVAAGRMPQLAMVLGAGAGGEAWVQAHSVEGVLSILPSTTVAAWASVFTGVGVAEHGVAGNEQFNRETRTFHAPAPVTVPDVHEMMRTFNGELVGEMVERETLFEKLPELRSHVSLAHVHRGADVFTMPSGVRALSIFSAFVEGATTDQEAGYRLEGAKALDRESVEAALGAVDQHGVPDLQVLYFPGIDLHTHVADDALESQKDFLEEVIDPALGRVFARWRRENVLDQTWVVLTADHGHTPVLDDDRHSLAPALEEDDEPPAILRALGFELRPLEVGTPEGPWSAAYAYQGAFAYIHLADRSSCDDERCDWSRPPRAEDVLAVARAFHEASGDPTHPLGGTLDLVFAREPQPIEADALPFEIFDGDALVPVGEYLAAHPRPDLLALEPRLRALAVGPYGHRAGDVLLLAKSGTERPIEERFYFSGPYRSWHGSPAASDSRVPLIVARPGMAAEAIAARVERALGQPPPGGRSQLEITPLLVSLLSDSDR